LFAAPLETTSRGGIGSLSINALAIITDNYCMPESANPLWALAAAAAIGFAGYV
jgi:hypothetical protein